MTLRSTVASVLLLCACALTALGQSYATLTPERTLQIEFQARSNYIIPPNVLYAFGGYVTILQPYTQITGSLYNGNTLLGTSTSSVGAGYTGTYSFYPIPTTWKAPGSPWNFPAGDPATVDFTSILDGTINGRIDITINAGSIRFDLSKVALPVIQAAYANGGQSVPPALTVTSVRIIPELPGDPPPPPPVEPPPPVVGDDDDFVITTAALRTACESANGSAVVFNNSVTIINSSTTQIPVPCTLMLGSNVTLSADQVSLSFGGPLIIQSQGKATVSLNKSMLSAPFLTVDLRGTGSAVTATESTLRALNGSLNIALGNEGKVEISKKYSGQTNALSATGSILVTGLQKFLGSISNANVTAPLGFQLDMNGAEGVFKVMDGVTFSTLQGSIGIAATGSKGLVEISDANFRFTNAFTLRLAGNESTVKLNKQIWGRLRAMRPEARRLKPVRRGPRSAWWKPTKCASNASPRLRSALHITEATGCSNSRRAT